jgi:hypothetical protein
MRNKTTRLSGVNGEGVSPSDKLISTTAPFNSADLSDDVLIGVEDISVFLYGPEHGPKETNLRRTYHGIAKGDIPTFKIGGKRHARKSAILKRIAEQEQAD